MSEIKGLSNKGSELPTSELDLNDGKYISGKTQHMKKDVVRQGSVLTLNVNIVL